MQRGSLKMRRVFTGRGGGGGRESHEWRMYVLSSGLEVGRTVEFLWV